MAVTTNTDIEVHQELTLKGTVAEAIHVHRDAGLVVMGVAEGGVTVAAGGYARIPGTVHGLHIAAGGYVVLSGTCVGDVINDGGRLDLTGTITGQTYSAA